jgi:hypothetical protein
MRDWSAHQPLQRIECQLYDKPLKARLFTIPEGRFLEIICLDDNNITIWSKPAQEKSETLTDDQTGKVLSLVVRRV